MSNSCSSANFESSMSFRSFGGGWHRSNAWDGKTEEMYSAVYMFAKSMYSSTRRLLSLISYGSAPTGSSSSSRSNETFG